MLSRQRPNDTELIESTPFTNGGGMQRSVAVGGRCGVDEVEGR